MAWFGLCLLFVLCLFFKDLVFDGHDNTLEECYTESLKSMSSRGCGLELAATI